MLLNIKKKENKRCFKIFDKIDILYKDELKKLFYIFTC